MAVASGVSVILSTVFTVILFCIMQFYKPWLASSEIKTIFGGFIGSWLFVFMLTTVSNFETTVLGQNFQSKIFPEIAFCLMTAVFACAMIHRVCASTCIIFSMIALYYVNRISQKAQQKNMAPVDVHFGKKKKK